MKISMFCLPTLRATLEERRALRPLARNNERHARMIEDLRDLARWCDDAEFHAFFLSEHHLQSEGWEVSPSPMLVLADLAARTRNIRIGPLGRVLAMSDPLKVAADFAVLDHLSGGRVIAGFARGYQCREVDVLGQHVRASAATMDGSDRDRLNWEIHEEFFGIVMKAWAEDAISVRGRHYQVPYPAETGIAGWPAAPHTAEFGAPGEVDGEGVLRRACVGPRPVQEPCPEVWHPFAVSEKTIAYCARKGIVPASLCLREQFIARCRLYRETAVGAGRNLALGERMAAVRFLSVGASRDEAVSLLGRTALQPFRHYFHHFGFGEGFRMPEDEATYAGRPLPKEEITPERAVACGAALAGTRREVEEQLRRLGDLGGEGSLEHLVWFFDNSMERDEARRQIETVAGIAAGLR